MKRILTTFICLVAVVLGAAAQQRFNPDDFRNKLERHIIKEARLSRQEADSFFPIYTEMKEKQRKLSQQAQELKRNRPAPNATDKDYSTTVQRIADLEVQCAKVQQEYYKKLCKVISPQKVYAAILADDDFHRRMVQQMGQEHKRKQGDGSSKQSGKK